MKYPVPDIRLRYELKSNMIRFHSLMLGGPDHVGEPKNDIPKSIEKVPKVLHFTLLTRIINQKRTFILLEKSNKFHDLMKHYHNTSGHHISILVSMI